MSESFCDLWSRRSYWIFAAYYVHRIYQGKGFTKGRVIQEPISRGMIQIQACFFTTSQSLERPRGHQLLEIPVHPPLKSLEIFENPTFLPQGTPLQGIFSAGVAS